MKLALLPIVLVSVLEITFVSASGFLAAAACRSRNPKMLLDVMDGFVNDDIATCFEVIVEEDQPPEMLTTLLSQVDDSIIEFIDNFEYVCLKGSPTILRAYLDNARAFPDSLWYQTKKYVESARDDFGLISDAIVFDQYMSSAVVSCPFEVYVSEMIFHLIHLLRLRNPAVDQAIGSIKVLGQYAMPTPDILRGVIEYVLAMKGLGYDLKIRIIDAMPDILSYEKSHAKSAIALQRASPANLVTVAAPKPKKGLRSKMAEKVKRYKK